MIQLKAPDRNDNPKLKRTKPIKKQEQVQKTKITSLFFPKKSTDTLTETKIEVATQLEKRERLSESETSSLADGNNT